MEATIIAEKGNYLLVAQGERFAVIERRNNRLYSCHGGKRDGIPIDQLAAISAILDEEDWVERATAQAALDDAAARQARLGEQMR
jgi:hypothetical protein